MYKYFSYAVPFDHFVLEILEKRLMRTRRWFVGPQVEFLRDAGGGMMVAFVARLESLDADFATVRERTGAKSPLRHVNNSAEKGVSLKGLARTLAIGAQERDWLRLRHLVGRKESHPNWRDFYGYETRAAVARMYREDIETFDYAF